MNIISCERCGVVIDTNRIPEPDIDNEDGSINTEVAGWRNRGYEATIGCPQCATRIYYSDGDEV